MIYNYLKITFRNIKRNKLHSFINVLSLSVGIATCILIFLFVKDELSYDSFHAKGDRIYKIVRETSDNNELFGVTPLALGEALRTDFPQLQVSQTMVYRNVVSYKEKVFMEEKFYYVDSNFPRMFDFPLVEGDPKTAFMNTNSILITQRIAQKYFGNENPVGKTLVIDNTNDMVVTGVMKDVPHNSFMQFDFLAPKPSWMKAAVNNWRANMFSTYVMLPENYLAGNISDKLGAFLEKHIGKDAGEKLNLKLQPLKDIYLYSSDIKFNSVDKIGDIQEVYIFVVIAVFVLLLAVINYTNLAMSKYSFNMNEVGIRKVFGAGRKQLVLRFLSESIFTTIFAFLLSILMIELFLPIFNSIMDKELQLSGLLNYHTLTGMILFGMLISLIAGIFPALFFSSFSPIKILKGSLILPSGSLLSRKILIITQFTIAIVFMICLTILFSQTKFIINKNLGFDKENLLAIELPGQLRGQFDLYRNSVLQHNEIVNISMAGAIPPNQLGGANPVVFNVNGEEKTLLCRVLYADYDYVETLGLKLKEGRSFSKNYGADEEQSIILNETAARSIQSKNTIGEIVTVMNKPKKVIGVVKDFNYWRLQEIIEPVVIIPSQNRCWQVLARIRSGNVAETIDIMEAEWKKYFQDWPFQFSFVDDNVNALYQKEMKLKNLAKYVTVLASIIACLGLLGISMFNAQKRMKEVSIRKVLGAPNLNIIKILSREFIFLVVMANVVASPVAYYLMDKWLEDFAYKTGISWWIFVLCGGIALLIALATVSYQAIKVATANPIESLKYE
jgi:putative ABC transport system permease protein